MSRLAAPFVGLTLFLLAASASAADPAHFELIVFQQGNPVEGVEVLIDGRVVGATDTDGALAADIPSGRHELVLRRGEVELKRLDLLTDAGESIQMLADVPAGGGVASVDIESSGSARARAVGEQQEGGESEQPPGALKGRIVSAESGAPVANAKLYFAGIEASVTTNDQGRYEAEIPPGSYTVSVVHPDYATQTLQDVRVIPGKVVTSNIKLSPAGLQLADYTVTAPYVEGSVASVFEQQKEASGVTEVLGAEQMSRAGDSSAADALQRVTGLTIEDGKYVLIRGQPSRYTLTLWNGSPLPSPDPIKRIVPLDLFPTGVLSQIRVEKSYDPQFPGSFGGGLIGLDTVGVPGEGFGKVSASIGGNTQTTGASGLDYPGGETDFLGYDDGTRQIPAGLKGADTPPEVEQAAKGFSDTWELGKSTIGPDTGLGVSGGNSYQALGGKVGFLASFDWSRSYDKSKTIKRDYSVGTGGDLTLRNDKTERRTDMDVSVGGLFVAAAEWEDTKLRSNTFLIRKTYQRSQINEGIRAVSQDRYEKNYLLEWNERELVAEQLIGQHDFDWFQLDWRGLLAQSNRYSPDRRDYTYVRRNDGTFIFTPQGQANRNFVESSDDIGSFDADVTVPLVDNDTWKWNVQTGFSFFDQDRESQTRRYGFEPNSNADLTQDPNDLLDPANIGDTIDVSDQTQTNDNYLGQATVTGVYARTEVDWSDELKASGGLRQETADFSVRTFQGAGSAGPKKLEGNFKRTDVLPAAGVTWKYREDMQLRGSVGRSVSRPVLNELSPTRYEDPDTGEEFLGNPDLEPAVIDAFDLRWEWYPTSQEQLSAGVFVKDYDNPIERSFVAVGGSSYLNQVQNAKGAEVTGTEFSARSQLPRLMEPLGLDADWLEQMYAQANLSFIDSSVTLAKQDLATDRSRPLQGQADQVFNLQVGYDGGKHDATLLFNRVGRRLQIAGVQGAPNVFQKPVSRLDFTYTYQPSDALKFKVSAGNLLNPKEELVQGGKLYRSTRAGRDFSVGVDWRW